MSTNDNKENEMKCKMKPKFHRHVVKFGARVCAVETSVKVRDTYAFASPKLSITLFPSASTPSCDIVI